MMCFFTRFGKCFANVRKKWLLIARSEKRFLQTFVKNVCWPRGRLLESREKWLLTARSATIFHDRSRNGAARNDFQLRTIRKHFFLRGFKARIPPWIPKESFWKVNRISVFNCALNSARNILIFSNFQIANLKTFFQIFNFRIENLKIYLSNFRVENLKNIFQNFEHRNAVFEFSIIQTKQPLNEVADQGLGQLVGWCAWSSVRRGITRSPRKPIKPANPTRKNMIIGAPRSPTRWKPCATLSDWELASSA